MKPIEPEGSEDFTFHMSTAMPTLRKDFLSFPVLTPALAYIPYCCFASVHTLLRCISELLFPFFHLDYTSAFFI